MIFNCQEKRLQTVKTKKTFLNLFIFIKFIYIKYYNIIFNSDSLTKLY